jgi:hypothetical protein
MRWRDNMGYHNKKVIDPETGKKVTPFELKYGIHVTEFAKNEGTTPAAIHMRVMRFGTAWQRRARPTVCEILTGYSKRYIASKINLSYNHIAQKMHTRDGAFNVVERLRDIPDTGDFDGWLMIDHPDYETWRYTHTIKLLESLHGPL